MPRPRPGSLHAVNKAVLDLNLQAYKQVFLAYSGGQDSQVLLHALAQASKEQGFVLTALHVNYGLADAADQWAAFCFEQCDEWRVLFESKQLRLGKGNVENQARKARYDWFSSRQDADSVLLTAHHQADQAETLIQRLLRGSGVRGLSAMPQNRPLGLGKLLRPLLVVSKAEIKDYAALHHLAWVEDESNQSMDFDRNFIRHKIIPALLTRWPQATKQIAASAHYCAEGQGLLKDLAEIDAQACQSTAELPPYSELFNLRLPLKLSAFNRLSRARQRNLLQVVLQALSEDLPQTQLEEWLAQISKHCLGAHSACETEGLKMVLHDQHLFFLRPSAMQRKQAIYWQPSLTNSIKIEALNCDLKSFSVEQKSSEAQAHIQQIKKDQKLSLHWRQGGERGRRQGENFSRALKKIFQEKHFPPWMRDGLPFISLEGELVWSAALGGFLHLQDHTGKLLRFELMALSSAQKAVQEVAQKAAQKA